MKIRSTWKKKEKVCNCSEFKNEIAKVLKKFETSSKKKSAEESERSFRGI